MVCTSAPAPYVVAETASDTSERIGTTVRRRMSQKRQSSATTGSPDIVKVRAGVRCLRCDGESENLVQSITPKRSRAEQHFLTPFEGASLAAEYIEL